MSNFLFFVASKVVWAVIRPETIVLLFLGCGLLALHRHRLRLAKWLLGLPIVFLTALFVFPLGEIILRPLEQSYPGNPKASEIDGIIVLGGGEDQNLSSYWGQPVTKQSGDRFLATIALAQQYPDAKVMFTGGSGKLGGSGPRRINVAESIFLSAGIDPERLILENKSRNTAENAQYSRELLGANDDGTWILVTSAFHMRRAVASFCAAGWTRLVPWPTDYRSGDFVGRIGWGLTGNLDALNVGVKEWIGILAYRLTGRSVSDYSQGCPEPL